MEEGDIDKIVDFFTCGLWENRGTELPEVRRLIFISRPLRKFRQNNGHYRSVCISFCLFLLVLSVVKTGKWVDSRACFSSKTRNCWGLDVRCERKTGIKDKFHCWEAKWIEGGKECWQIRENMVSVLERLDRPGDKDLRYIYPKIFFCLITDSV